MPKETFFNLQDKKREVIENAAIDEFAQHGYDNASINRIVSAAGIAKGSFYQYFEDKKDVFIHLINTTAQKKIKYISPILTSGAQLSFFEMIREMWISGLRFANDNIKLAKIANEVFKNQHRGLYSEILSSNEPLAIDFYKQMIETAIKKGELRDDIDIEYVSYTITALSISSVEYYFAKIRNENMHFTSLDDDMLDTVELFLDLMKNGIAKRK